jgi:hypothetical protein
MNTCFALKFFFLVCYISLATRLASSFAKFWEKWDSSLLMCFPQTLQSLHVGIPVDCKEVKSDEKWTHVFDREQQATNSNKTTSGWFFIIHSSRRMPKMCYMISVVHDEQNQWRVLQNEILPWWCNKYSYGMIINQIFVRRHMEMSDVIH